MSWRIATFDINNVIPIAKNLHVFCNRLYERSQVNNLLSCHLLTLNDIVFSMLLSVMNKYYYMLPLLPSHV